MKAKGKLNIKTSLIFVFAFSATIILTILRFIQVNSLIDPETGFFTGQSPLNVVFYALIAASVLCFFITPFFSKGANEFRSNGRKSLTCYFALLAVAAFVLDAVKAAVTRLSEDEAAYLQSAAVVLRLGNILRVVFACLSAAYFILIFMDERKGGSSASKRKALALAPAVWSAGRLIVLFTTKISYIRISDLLLQIIYLSLFSLFFINFAQQKSGVYSDGGSWKLFAYGTSAAVIALSTMAVRLVFTFVEGGAKLHEDYPFFIADFVIGLFIFSFLFGKKKYIAEETSVSAESPVEAEASAEGEETKG